MAVEFFSTAEGHEDLVHGGAMTTIVDTAIAQMCMVLHQDVILTLSILAKYRRPVLRPSPETTAQGKPNRIYRVDLVVGPSEKTTFYKCDAVLRDPNFGETSETLAEFSALLYGVPTDKLNQMPKGLVFDTKQDPYPECASYHMGMKVGP